MRGIEIVDLKPEMIVTKPRVAGVSRDRVALSARPEVDVRPAEIQDRSIGSPKLASLDKCGTQVACEERLSNLQVTADYVDVMIAVFHLVASERAFRFRLGSVGTFDVAPQYLQCLSSRACDA